MSGHASSIEPAAFANGSALLARCGVDSPSGAWQVAAAFAGVAGADAFLCHLSRSIIAALERLAASAEAAKARIGAARDSAAVDAQSHCEELLSLVESTAATKRVALERELVSVDAALERLRAVRGAVAEDVATLSDTELKARYSELTVRLDVADAHLLALPTTVVEIPNVSVVVDEAALLAGAAVFGQVVASEAITAADLTFASAPTHAHPGCTLIFRLGLQGALVAAQSEDELPLEVSLVAAAAATHIEATLKAEGAEPQLLQARFSSFAPGRCITISIDVPLAAPIGSVVCFGPLTVSGQPVYELLGPLVVDPFGPADLSPEHAAWLQSILPAGGSSSPCEWQEVYRATIHGFAGEDFHRRCDWRSDRPRPRLLVLVRARLGGWLFGGFTAVGFSPHQAKNGWITDPASFLFSLMNSLGRPEKLEPKGTNGALYYSSHSIDFGTNLVIYSTTFAEADAWTETGGSYAKSESTGAHPMAQGVRCCKAAEVVAWVV